MTEALKVLIIEDEAIISFGYRLQLEQMGLEVIGSARSSEEAEALLDPEGVPPREGQSDGRVDQPGHTEHRHVAPEPIVASAVDLSHPALAKRI